MDCFGTDFTHVQTCDVTRVQSATQYDCFGAYFTHCFGVRLSVFGFRFSAFGFWPSACGFRFSSFGFRLPASCFVCTASAFGFRLSAFGFRRLDPQPRTSLRLMSLQRAKLIRSPYRIKAALLLTRLTADKRDPAAVPESWSSRPTLHKLGTLNASTKALAFQSQDVGIGTE